jgi:hypothetical protein
MKALIDPWLDQAILAAVAEALPALSWPKYHLARARFSLRKYEEAAELCRAILADPDAPTSLRSGAFELLCEGTRRQEPGRAAEELHAILGAVADDLFPESLALYQGLLHFYEGRSDDALAAFQLAGSGGNGLHDRLRVSLGTTTYLHSAAVAVAGPQASERITDFGLRHEPRSDDDVVLMCAADSRYFGMFFPTWVASAIHTAGDILIHAHVVNPRPAFFEEVTEVLSAIPHARVNITTSEADFPSPRPFFATIRYLIAPQLLDRYRRPLLITDIDSVVIKPPQAGARALAGAVGIKRKADGWLEFPWTVDLATYTLIPPNTAGMRFAELIRNYFWTAFDVSGAKNGWWIDQNALLYADQAVAWQKAQVVDLSLTDLNQPIRTNSSMEPKEKFIAREQKNFPLRGAAMAAFR